VAGSEDAVHCVPDDCGKSSRSSNILPPILSPRGAPLIPQSSVSKVLPEPPASEAISVDVPPHFVRWLWVLWLTTFVGRFLAGLVLHGPVIFGDEVLYWEMARSFHRFGNFNMDLIPGHLPTVLYSVVISPAFIWNPPRTVYLVVKLISSLLMASAVFPAYGLAREFLDHKWSLLVAVVTALVSGGIYSATVMAESLFFPMFVLTVWLAFRTLESGRIFDAVATGVLLTIGFFVKIQAMFLAAAYLPVFLVWAVGSRVTGKGKQTWNDWLRAATVRAVPLLIFAAMIGLRMAFGLAHHQTVAISIFGDWYSNLARVSVHLDRARFLATALAMVQGLAISTLFAPLAALLLSIAILRKVSFRLLLFWSLTASCTIVYLVMVARHTVLYDERLRVYERYFFVVTPLLWMWFFVIKERLRPWILWTTVVGLVGLCAWRVAQYAPTTVIWWDSPIDSPTFTLFFYLRFPPNFMPYTTVSGLIALALLAVLALYGASRKRAATAALPWVLALLLLNSGWYMFGHSIIAPTQMRPLQAIFKLKRSFSSHDRLALVYDTNLPLNVLMFSYFWWDNPITLYGFGEHPAWFGRRLPTRSGKPDFSQLSEDYVVDIGEPDLDLPAVGTWDDPKITIYRNIHEPASR
jgi:Dolichyl-phosphate-mannose-protein mannosyltransferase